MPEPRVEYKVWIEIEEIHRDGPPGDEDRYVADPMPHVADVFDTRDEAEEYRQRLITGRDSITDDESKRKIIFLSKDALSIAAGVRESDEDPTCGGAGGGGGSVEFTSGNSSSGQSHTTLLLPCANWKVLGRDPGTGNIPQGYKYVDKELDQSTCKLVLIKHRKLIKAVCQEPHRPG